MDVGKTQYILSQRHFPLIRWQRLPRICTHCIAVRVRLWDFPFFRMFHTVKMSSNETADVFCYSQNIESTQLNLIHDVSQNT